MSLVNYEKTPPPMCDDEGGWHLREFQRLLDRMGNPERDLPIIHIAGTKGKGSTTHLLVELLKAQGYRRVGSFISPHIEFFRERICIDGEPISEAEFVRLLNRVRAHLPQSATSTEGFRTTFEVLTAMALEAYRAHDCEAVVLETGLGGRLDSTNVPLARVALVTAIGYDHQKVLGKTLKKIAYEKAGIIKPGTHRAILGLQKPSRQMRVLQVVQEQAEKSNVPLTICSRKNPFIQKHQADAKGFLLTAKHGEKVMEDLRFPLLGRHQLDNLESALAALQAFMEEDKHPIDPEKLRAGIAAAKGPGRMEIIRHDPVQIIDAAHCPLSSRAAIDALHLHFPDRPCVLVLGYLMDKRIDNILSELANHESVRHVYTHAPSSPRAMPSEFLAKKARKHFTNATNCETVEKALEAACQFQKQNPDCIILATGSFYSLARARHYLKKALPGFLGKV
ncbi:MAG: bifunctional folylpolyglutamate synthase/dihydrofolate synthase [Candidatus Sumerlaeia bacterium]